MMIDSSPFSEEAPSEAEAIRRDAVLDAESVTPDTRDPVTPLTALRSRLLIRDEEFPNGIIRQLTADEWATLDAARQSDGAEAGLREAMEPRTTAPRGEPLPVDLDEIEMRWAGQWNESDDGEVRAWRSDVAALIDEVRTLRSDFRLGICGVIWPGGPRGEPLACGWPPNPDDAPMHTHSWAGQPSFTVATDPMWDNPTEPRTKAGQRLIAAFPANAADASRPEFIRHVAQSILAIETEARAALQAAPASIDPTLEKALVTTLQAYGFTETADFLNALLTEYRGLSHVG